MILVTEFMDAAAVDRLRAVHPVTYDPGLADRQGEIPALMRGVRALIVRNRTEVRGALLAAAPDLACVGRLGVGLDNIDTAACAARGVTVYPATGANNLSVAEYVIGTAMALLRGAYAANAAMIAGSWPRQACAGRELSGKVLGLVGFGAIATSIRPGLSRFTRLRLTSPDSPIHTPSLIRKPGMSSATRWSSTSLWQRR